MKTSTEDKRLADFCRNQIKGQLGVLEVGEKPGLISSAGGILAFWKLTLEVGSPKLQGSEFISSGSDETKESAEANCL